MICLQSDRQHPQRRRNPPISANRASQNVQQQKVQQATPKMKHVLCFLCLFDGLRTPSIRRLIRKPRTVCKMPLLTFDPSFYAPSSTEAIENVYKNVLNCTCDIYVDPGMSEVLEVLKSKGSSSHSHSSNSGLSVPERILVHYFGQGCHPPGADGSLFFFSDDRDRYRPMKILNLIRTCSSPLCFIFDCNSAAAIEPQLKSQSDIFAFFSCEADEGLPLSTDAPIDLFSSCLLSAYDTAVWWNVQKHSTIYEEPKRPKEENNQFLSGFLHAILDAIAYETQDLNTYQAFTKDPAIATLFRGFALAQRVMLSFNVHSRAIPELQQMAYHSFWDVWDIAIDCCITLDEASAIPMLYNLCIETFETFSSPGIFPIYSYFMKIPSHSLAAALHLLEFLDGKGNHLIDSAATSSLPYSLLEMPEQSEVVNIILAKLLTSKKCQNLYDNLQFTFINSQDSDIYRSGALYMISAIIHHYNSDCGSLTRFCFENILSAAPMTSFLLGLLYERGSKPASIPGFLTKVGALIKSPEDGKNDQKSYPDTSREDVRASAVFLLGNMNDQNALKLLRGVEYDKSPLVRQQLCIALLKLTKLFNDPQSNEMLNRLADDPSDMVRNFVNINVSTIAMQKNQNKDLTESYNPIFGYFIKSVHDPDFQNRYSSCIFSYPNQNPIF